MASVSGHSQRNQCTLWPPGPDNLAWVLAVEGESGYILHVRKEVYPAGCCLFGLCHCVDDVTDAHGEDGEGKTGELSSLMFCIGCRRLCELFRHLSEGAEYAVRPLSTDIGRDAMAQGRNLTSHAKDGNEIPGPAWSNKVRKGRTPDRAGSEGFGKRRESLQKVVEEVAPCQGAVDTRGRCWRGGGGCQWQGGGR